MARRIICWSRPKVAALSAKMRGMFRSFGRRPLEYQYSKKSAHVHTIFNEPKDHFQDKKSAFSILPWLQL
jgi:hypothetical protein